jgi:hypothetical protein
MARVCVSKIDEYLSNIGRHKYQRVALVFSVGIHDSFQHSAAFMLDMFKFIAAPSQFNRLNSSITLRGFLYFKVDSYLYGSLNATGPPISNPRLVVHKG